MSFQGVCDAWHLDLVTNVGGLVDAKVHLYAPWSLEALSAAHGERHLAIYPTSEPEVAEPWTIADKPGDLITAAYAIVVWEEAASEATRLYDDDEKNVAWLELYEAIRARLYVQANTALGQTNGYTHYSGGTFDLVSLTRVMTLRFTVRYPQQFA